MFLLIDVFIINRKRSEGNFFCCHLFFWKVYMYSVYTSYIGLEIWPEAIFKSLVQSGFSLSHSRIIYGNLILIYNARLVSAKLALYLNSIWIFKKSRSPFMDPIKNITPKQWHNRSFFLLEMFRWIFTNSTFVCTLIFWIKFVFKKIDKN